MGHLWDGRQRESLFIEQGIQSGLLEAIEENTEWNEKISEFVNSEQFVEQKPLLERYTNWSKDNLSKELSSSLEIEYWLRRTPHRDEEADNFAILPADDWGVGVLRLHKTFRRTKFSSNIVCSFLGWNESDFETEEIDVFAVFSQEGPQVFLVEEQLAKIFDAVHEDNQEILRGEYADDVASLLEVGVLVWLPKALG